jgi:hypothetical protein
LLASFPELANVPTNHLQTAISVIAASNPQRAAQINAALERTQALYNASVQAQNAQQQIAAQHAALEQQRVQHWVAQEDAKFTAAMAKENPETVKAVNEQGAKILVEDYGVDPRAFAQVLQSTPALRSAEVQRILYDAIRYRIAQRDLVNKLDRSTVPVPWRESAAWRRLGRRSRIKSLLKRPKSEVRSRLVDRSQSGE